MLKTLFSAGLWRQVTDRLHQRTRSLEEQTRPFVRHTRVLPAKEQAKARPAGGEKPQPLAQRGTGPLQQEASDLSKTLGGIPKPLQAAETYSGWRRPAKRGTNGAGAGPGRLEGNRAGSALLQQKREQAQVLGGAGCGSSSGANTALSAAGRTAQGAKQPQHRPLLPESRPRLETGTGGLQRQGRGPLPRMEKRGGPS